MGTPSSVGMRCDQSYPVRSDPEDLSDRLPTPPRIRLERSGRKTLAEILSVVDQINGTRGSTCSEFKPSVWEFYAMTHCLSGVHIQAETCRAR